MSQSSVVRALSGNTLMVRMKSPRRRHHRVPAPKTSSSGIPVVRMLTTATTQCCPVSPGGILAPKRRGRLVKRLRSHQSFRSVLSMDVELDGFMPNLKISARNTLQVTGAQDLRVLIGWLPHTLWQLSGCGSDSGPSGARAPTKFMSVSDPQRPTRAAVSG